MPVLLFHTEDSEAINTPNPGVQRNIVLFQGFCAMKYAVYALCVNAHKYVNCTECKSVQQQHHSEAEMDQTSASADGMIFSAVTFWFDTS